MIHLRSGPGQALRLKMFPAPPIIEAMKRNQGSHVRIE
jgi:hypothetical protein